MTDHPDDPRLAEARAVPIAEIVDRLGIAGLRRSGVEMVGGCPVCGNDGKRDADRFAVNTRKNVWLCRRCDVRGDGLALIRHVMACDFPAALAWLCGEREVEVDPAERRRREDEARRREAAAADAERRHRAQAIEAARAIWAASLPAEGTPVRDYLTLRGFAPELLPEIPISIRYAPDHAYWRQVGDDTAAREWHRGPAMIAGIQAPGGRVTAVHQTWIDLDQPKGKARIVAGDAVLPAKLVRGSKKGGAIRLGGGVVDAMATPTLVMGEGIETTLAARCADAVPARFWAGVDLGNMAGRRRLGQGLKYAGIPEMNDLDAFVPPRWVRRLIYIQDGDSEARMTRAKLEAGLRRAMALRPGLEGLIVHAGEGVDMNDVLLGRMGRVAAREGAA